MELPTNLIGKAAAEGHVYWFKKGCPIGIPDHMHVCIKHNDEYLIFSTCSSQVTKSVLLAQKRGFNINTYPVLSPNVNNGFSQPTYIDCNKPWVLSGQQFGELYRDGKITDTTKGGNLSTDEMGFIANGIKLSTVVADDIKELF